MKEISDGKLVINYKDLDVILSDKADTKILNLLARTVLGTKGGMRYQLTGAAERIKEYNKNIRFISLYKSNKLAGTVGFCYRKLKAAGVDFHSSYLRYFAFAPSFQVNADIRNKEEKQRKQSLSDSLKNRVMNFLRKPGLLDFPYYNDDEKRIIYAYVESANERSKNIIDQIGFQHIRTFLTVAFSRFNPVDSKKVSILANDEQAEMRRLLEEFYSDYAFYTDEFAFLRDKFYVIKEGNEIIAGLSVIPNTFKIVDMPGVWGWVFMKVLTRLPYYRKIIRPDQLRFLTFECMYCKKGREKDLETLMETACAREGINMGLCWLDDRSNLYDTLRTEINMGAINRMLNAKPGLVFARFINFEESDKEQFYDRPAFISGFDFT